MSSAPVFAGLCERCTHVRRVESRRGSVFLLCELSVVDPNFPKYPPLPVLRCRGFEARGDRTAPGL
ncbi:MAG: hypothetical protein M3409_10300 [Gemmatimonadota bacterium]|nr:hypothetical protein [Gemmatimonadota bacterium]